MREVNDRDVAALGPKLLPYVDALGSDPALSPDRSPATHAPVFLLHGVDENVIRRPKRRCSRTTSARPATRR